MKGEHEMNEVKEKKFLNRTIGWRMAVVEAVAFLAMMASLFLACL